MSQKPLTSFNITKDVVITNFDVDMSARQAWLFLVKYKC